MEKPEDVIFTEWLRARRIRDGSTGAKRSAFYSIADMLQYMLQDFGPYGHRLVWGSEFAKRRGDR
jgi:hypothetical protein